MFLLSLRDAWHQLGNMNSAEAAKGYVKLLSSLAPNWNSASPALKGAEPVQPEKSQGNGPVFSQPMRPDDK
jgi:hypothetical protein